MYDKFLRTGILIVLLFVIIYLGSLIRWIFSPLIVFFQTLFIPILLSGVLYYISRPIVRFLSKKMSRSLAILIVFFGFGSLFVALIALILPELKRQVTSLIQSMPTIVSQIQQLLIVARQNEFVTRFDLMAFFELEEQIEQIGAFMNRTISEVLSNTVGFLGAVINILIPLFIVPIILFYLLKEGEKLPNSFLRLVQKEKRDQVRHILVDMDTMLSHYIQGILIVCSFIGGLCYVAFNLIGLDYALILALIAALTNVIPFVGPWIGAVPSVTVGFLQSPLMGLLTIVAIVVIQQIESIFVQPQVMGKKMSMHPVTVLFLVLVAGRFIGIVGMLLAIPVYAIGKVIVTHSYRLWKIRKLEDKLDEVSSKL